MEHLNKQQIILLALLVSFVSSIATGISVVSLMQQDQTVPVTQTINNVIERTIERASSSSNPSAPSVMTKETIVVKEDEAVVGAIDTASKSIAKIYWSVSTSPERFIGLGVIASSTGTIVGKVESEYRGTYTAHLAGGNSVPVTLSSYDSARGLSVFQPEQSSDPQDARVYAPIPLADPDAVKVGQSVVAIANSENLSVATGIISSFDRAQGVMQTSIKESALANQALLIDLSGEVVGIKAQDSFDGAFIPDSIIQTYATP